MKKLRGRNSLLLLSIMWFNCCKVFSGLFNVLRVSSIVPLVCLVVNLFLKLSSVCFGRSLEENERLRWREIMTCSSSSMTSSMVIMPTASSSGRAGSGVSLIFKMSERVSLERKLLLRVEPRWEELWALTGRLFHLVNAL